MDEIERSGAVNLTELNRLAESVSDEDALPSIWSTGQRNSNNYVYLRHYRNAERAMLSHEHSVGTECLFKSECCSTKTTDLVSSSDVPYRWCSFYAGFDICRRHLFPRHFDPGVALAQIRDEECTVALPAFETVASIICHQDRTDSDFASLRTLMCVGVPESSANSRKRLECPLLNACGQTEACAFSTVRVGRRSGTSVY